MISNLYLLYFLLILVGFCAGTIVGIMGGSGVVAVVPLLTIMGYNVHVSIGTSLFVDVIASIAAAYTYRQNGHLDVSEGLWMAITAVIGAQLGSLLGNRASGFTMNWGFGIYLIIMGLGLLKTGIQSITEKVSKFANSTFLKGGLETPQGKRRAIIISCVFGFGIGIISGFVGAGGGMMFLFVLILVLGMELKLAIGTSTLIMAITACSAAIGYGIQGNLDIVAALIISIGTIIAGRIGAKAANQLKEETLGKIIAFILIGLGILMVLNGIFNP